MRSGRFDHMLRCPGANSRVICKCVHEHTRTRMHAHRAHARSRSPARIHRAPTCEVLDMRMQMPATPHFADADASASPQIDGDSSMLLIIYLNMSYTVQLDYVVESVTSTHAA
eukprot:3329687-Pleurochrysis_carterae.AAC.8